MMVKEFINTCFIPLGMCVDFAVHRGDDKNEDRVEGEHGSISPHNPHAHILLTTRKIDSTGFSKLKAREWESWNNPELLKSWREAWANIQNKMFQRKGLKLEVSHLSYKERGEDRQPTEHLGPGLSALERKGIQTGKGNKNRAIQARNKEREEQKPQRQRGR
jgi:hypothetical protein